MEKGQGKGTDTLKKDNDFVRRGDVKCLLENTVCLHEELPAQIDIIPAADVVPVRHGRWISDKHGYHCSECKKKPGTVNGGKPGRFFQTTAPTAAREWTVTEMYDELIATLRESRDKRMLDAADAIEELEKLTDAQLDIIKQYQVYLTMQHWIPVTELLPKPGEESLVLVSKSGMEVALYEEGIYGEAEWFTTSGKLEGVTHWMPLPEPPKEE